MSLADNNINTSVSGWIDSLLAKGKIAFTLKDFRENFPKLSESATKKSLNRLFRKGKAVSVHQGYYIIILPQYASRGMLPPTMFIDGLMKHLERSYYVGLLSAASLHGAAHQQPQEFFVFTKLPALRSVRKKTIKINYISKKQIPDQLLDSRKTETGYIKISSPELTAADLVQFEKRIGGLNRAATVINELTEEMRPEKFNRDFVNEAATTTIQRLGFILDEILDKKALAGALYNASKNAGLTYYQVPLKTSGDKKGFPINKQWKLIVNTKIEPDE